MFCYVDFTVWHVNTINYPANQFALMLLKTSFLVTYEVFFKVYLTCKLLLGNDSIMIWDMSWEQISYILKEYEKDIKNLCRSRYNITKCNTTSTILYLCGIKNVYVTSYYVIVKPRL